MDHINFDIDNMIDLLKKAKECKHNWRHDPFASKCVCTKCGYDSVIKNVNSNYIENKGKDKE